MEVVIENRHIELKPDVKKTIAQRASLAFSHAQRVVNKILVVLADVNGPKGGEDKQCKVIVHCNNAPSVVVSEKQSSITRAVNIALRRAGFNVTKRMKKRCRLNREKVKCDDVELFSC